MLHLLADLFVLWNLLMGALLRDFLHQCVILHDAFEVVPHNGFSLRRRYYDHEHAEQVLHMHVALVFPDKLFKTILPSKPSITSKAVYSVVEHGLEC